MHTVRYGGKAGTTFRFAESKKLVVVRTESRALPIHATLTSKGRAALADLDLVTSVPSAGVQVFAARRGNVAAAQRSRTVLKKEKQLRFAGHGLKDPASGVPVIYTENAFVRFCSGVAESKCKSILGKYKLQVKKPLPYASNDPSTGDGVAYFVGAPEATGTKIFDLTDDLLNQSEVELCHPELVREMSYRRAFPQQWHLKKATIDGRVIDAHANVESAWEITRGEGIIIAIVDDGFDLTHEEFRSAGKIVAPRDVTRDSDDPSPRSGDMHGHACAGVAVADGLYGACGVAPKARLMPIRLASALGSQNEAEAFAWAADHDADIISCSWGPADGDYSDPSDPVHKQVVPLPDSTRLAIDYAVTKGRGGKGCVVLWAAGNGNESVDIDGYASYCKVIAVAACNDSGKHSAYSDKGKAVWCAFPSNHGYPSLTPGIWTTDLSGKAGYNDGHVEKGDAAGNYTNDFGGTSSAAPGVAGVGALVLSANPSLTGTQVREILKQSCDKIDKKGGKYDKKGHSNKYGYGRVNAATAVALAKQAGGVQLATAAGH
jgi:subtilisin family serine protease